MANILAISGSPHAKGNTAFAAEYALSSCGPGHETRLISLAGLSIAPCTGCFACERGGRCAIDDDMTDIYAALRWCDALVLATPVYMGMVSGQLKCVMDRTVALRSGYGGAFEMEGKIGGGIACGWFRNGGQETALQNIQTFLLQQAMLAANDGRPYSHAGAAIVGPAAEDALGQETIRALMANLIGNIEKGAKS